MLELIYKIKSFKEIKGNAAGGVLHIVLDDGNLEDSYILFCKEEAIKKNDKLAIKICDELLMLTHDEREIVYKCTD